MSGINVFSTLGQAFDTAANTFVASKMGAVMGIAAPIALAGVSLYITIYGYLIIAGKIQEPFKDFLIKCVKIIIIAAFSVSGSYGELVSAIEGFQQDMLNAVGESGTIYGALDKTANEGFKTLNKILEKKAAIHWRFVGDHVAYLAMYVIVAVAYLLLLVGVATTVMVSMLFFKILLAIGPIFVMCLMFPPVARFFDNWFGAVMSNLFVTVIGSAVASIALKIFAGASGVIDLKSKTADPWTGVFVIMAMAIVLFIASRSITSLAAGLGGGVASEAVSAGQAMASAIGLGRSSAATVKNVRKGWQAGKKGYSWAKGKFGGGNSMKESPPAKPIYNRTQKYN